MNKLIVDSNFKLKDINPDKVSGDKQESFSLEIFEQIKEYQDKLYASKSKSLLIILQGMDTSGKDGTVKHVFSGINPSGCEVTSFKVPTEEERNHDFLWRIHKRIPAKGMVGIFNRSHYEDVLVTKVHKLINNDIIKKRINYINEFERMLVNNDVKIVKIFLHISKEKQKKRLEKRLKDMNKRWKFSIDDIKERKYWEDYQQVYEETIRQTTTKNAPWYVVPANHNWYRNSAVAKIICESLKEMNLKYPKPSKDINFGSVRID